VVVDGGHGPGRRCPMLHGPRQSVPPVVLAAAGTGRLEVDLLAVTPPDVADPQVAGRRIERVPPRVAQAVRPDLRAAAGPADEGIVRGDAVRLGARGPGVDAEHLRQQDAEVLAVPVRIALASPVTQPDV